MLILKKMAKDILEANGIFNVELGKNGDHLYLWAIPRYHGKGRTVAYIPISGVPKRFSATSRQILINDYIKPFIENNKNDIQRMVQLKKEWDDQAKVLWTEPFDTLWFSSDYSVTFRDLDKSELQTVINNLGPYTKVSFKYIYESDTFSFAELKDINVDELAKLSEYCKTTYQNLMRTAGKEAYKLYQMDKQYKSLYNKLVYLHG